MSALQPFVFEVTRSLPSHGLEAGHRVVIDPNNLHHPVVALRDLEFGVGEAVALVRMGVLRDLNVDQPLDALVPMMAEEQGLRQAVGGVRRGVFAFPRKGKRESRTSVSHLRLVP